MLLDLFPIPRRYARVPGALAVALVVALVTVYLNERTPLAAGLLVAGVVVLILVYVIRARQKKEWIAFFQEENRRLLEIKGADGPAAYIPGQRARADKLRHLELKLTAQFNLCTALLANWDNGEALALLRRLPPPEKMPNPTLRLVYWTQLLRAHLQLGDREGADGAYAMTMRTLPEVSDLMKIGCLPYEIHYRILSGEYELALKQLGELPRKDLDEAGRDLLTAYRGMALRGLGASDKAAKLAQEVEGHDLLPATRKLLLSGAGPEQN